MLIILAILLFVVFAMIRSTKLKIDMLEGERETLEMVSLDGEPASLEDQEHIERNEIVTEKYRERLKGLKVGLNVILIAMLGVVILVVTVIFF